MLVGGTLASGLAPELLDRKPSNNRVLQDADARKQNDTYMGPGRADGTYSDRLVGLGLRAFRLMRLDIMDGVRLQKYDLRPGVPLSNASGNPLPYPILASSGMPSPASATYLRTYTVAARRGQRRRCAVGDSTGLLSCDPPVRLQSPAQHTWTLCSVRLMYAMRKRADAAASLCPRDGRASRPLPRAPRALELGMVSVSSDWRRSLKVSEATRCSLEEP